MPVYIILGLIAAFGYAFGSLFSKRALQEGCSPFLFTPVVATLQVIACLPFFFFDEAWPEPRYWYQPLITAICWHSGGILHARAQRVSDVSIIAPITGAKPVFVAFLLMILLGETVPISTWIAAVLVAVALVIVRTPNVTSSSSFLRSAGMAGIAMIAFGFSDVSIQHFAPRWGAFHYTAMIYAFGSLLGIGALPVLAPRYRALNRSGWKYLILTSLAYAIPGLCIGIAIGHYGHAAEVNVMYSSRVILTIVLVWTAGRLVGNMEHTGGHKIFIRRLLGAIVLMAAIGLIVLSAD